MVLEAHQEGAGDEPLPGLGLDDLQRRTHGVCGGVDRAGHQTIGVTEHDEHRAEIARVGQLLAGLLFGHALLGAQLAQLGDHGLEDVLVVHGLEACLAQMGQTEFRAPGEDRALVAHDDEVRDLALQQVVGRLDDAVLFAFGQHDRFLVRFGAAEQAVLEGVRGDREVDLDVDGPQDLFGWHVRLEGGERRIGLRRSVNGIWGIVHTGSPKSASVSLTETEWRGSQPVTKMPSTLLPAAPCLRWRDGRCP